MSQHFNRIYYSIKEQKNDFFPYNSTNGVNLYNGYDILEGNVRPPSTNNLHKYVENIYIQIGIRIIAMQMTLQCGF